MKGTKYQQIAAEIPSNVSLIAVSKNRDIEAIKNIYNQGQRLFAENRVQALLERKEVLPNDIKWHLIGHLQTNKVKSVVDFVTMIQSADSLKLLLTINNEAKKVNRVIPVLLQIKIAQEENKFGFDFKELKIVLKENSIDSFSNLSFCGVMGMSTLTEDNKLIQSEFQLLKKYFNELKSSYFEDYPDFKEISMGMSGDYKIAIEEGSTMVRIGSALF